MTDTPPPPTISVYDCGRHILASGSAIVTYGAPPLILAVGSDAVVVALDLYTPLTRPDNLVVGERTGPNSVAPDDPFTREISGYTVSVKLFPVNPDERSVTAPAFAGRIGPTSWHLSWEVSKDAPGMVVPAAPEPDWRPPELVPASFEVPNPWETPAHLLNPIIPA